MNKEMLNQKLKEQFEKIGEIYYTEHKDDLVINESYEAFFEEIETVNKELRKIEDEELAQQGLKRCPFCDNKTIIESRFCNMCGVKFAMGVDAVEEEKKIEKEIRKCYVCGEVLEEDALFCANCGMRQ